MKRILMVCILLLLSFAGLSACDIFVHDDTPDTVVVEDQKPDVVVHEEDTTPDVNVNIHDEGGDTSAPQSGK